jgi:uncharacterized RDD family membrane protein YckC
LPDTAAAGPRAASLRARTGGYLVDMVIFAAVVMVFTIIAGLQLLIVTHGATSDSEHSMYAFLAIIGVGTPAAWTALSLAVLLTRGQTAGQYVAGIRLRREDGAPLRPRDAIAWWFCFNPLLFSWPMALIAGFPLIFVVTLVLSRLSLALFLVLITLCVASPIIAIVSALRDARNRALHDRVARVVAVPVE